MLLRNIGLENFQKEILFEADSSEVMFAKEQELVEIGPHSYNLKKGGEGGFDYINNSEIPKFLGKSHSQKTKTVISEKAKLRVQSDETKRKISENNGMRDPKNVEKAVSKRRGVPLTEECKKKISESVKNYYANRARLV